MSEADVFTTCTWPERLRVVLTLHYGDPTHSKVLRGLSYNRVWCASFASVQLIVKARAEPNETVFYQDIAPQLVVQEVAIPAFIWCDEGTHWLVLEYIPHPTALSTSVLYFRRSQPIELEYA